MPKGRIKLNFERQYQTKILRFVIKKYKYLKNTRSPTFAVILIIKKSFLLNFDFAESILRANK